MSNSYQRTYSIKGLGFILCFLLNVSFCHSQGIAINQSGNSNYTGAILDLSNNNNAAGTYGFLLPYVTLSSVNTLTSPITGGLTGSLSGLMVYNTYATITTSNALSGTGVYYWNNTLPSPSWAYTGSNTCLAVTSTNGISISTDTVQLGNSNLTKNTTITLGSYGLYIQGSADTAYFGSNGQVGMGTTHPNQYAILDLTNPSSNLGLMLPEAPTSKLPTTAQPGMIAYDSTVNLLKIDSSGDWVPVSSNVRHGSVSFNAGTYWVVPSGVSIITIVASGAAGSSTTTENGGNGAVVTAKIAVTAGHVLGIICGVMPTYQDGTPGADAGAGGGGSYVWDAAHTTYPLVAAGGGGGAGTSSNGAAGSKTTSEYTTGTACGTATVGDGGNGGTATVTGAGGGGGGWNSDGTGTRSSTQGGLGYGFPSPGYFVGGRGATSGNQPNAYGGYGGGAGGGYNSSSKDGGGGGGGGYTGGGGGTASTVLYQYGGGGGGSGWYSSGNSPYTTAGDFGNNATYGTATQTNTGMGSVIIEW